MKNQKNTKLLPKITLILTKGDTKRYTRPSIRRMQYFLRNKAEPYLKSGYLITIRTTYCDETTNSGTYNNLQDLKWAFQAFVKEYIK